MQAEGWSAPLAEEGGGRPVSRPEPGPGNGVAPGLCQAIGRAATLALHDELKLAPKPGLVSFMDSGSHSDMDAHTFMRSLFALRHYFVRMAQLGLQHAPFEQLQACGRAAETRMLHATSGVNTHRGAIFMLGLLCASAGACLPDRRLDAAAVRAALHHHWGEALRRKALQASSLPGGVASRRHGLRGAAQEGALAFPAVFELGWPAWRDAQRRLATAGPLKRPAQVDYWRQVPLQTFFSIMADLDDSNLAHRGGLEGLHFARRAAAAYLAQGGAFTDGGNERAWVLHRAFVRRRLSPGGAADTLSACFWLHRLQRLRHSVAAGV